MPVSQLNPLPCRYYRVYTDLDVSCDESIFHFVEKALPLAVEETALVLVDVWSTHYIDSWLQRAGDVTKTSIVPVLEAARNIGMTIIHAPSPPVADRYASAPKAVPGPPPVPTGHRRRSAVSTAQEHTPRSDAIRSRFFHRPTSDTKPSSTSPNRPNPFPVSRSYIPDRRCTNCWWSGTSCT